MLDQASRYISVISLAIVATFSIFNIGYFWKIGFHFLGLADLTNLVYSLGTSMTALFVCIACIGFVKRIAVWAWLQIAIAIIGALLAVWGILRFSPRGPEPQLTENFAILVGFMLSGSILAMRTLGTARPFDWRNAWMLLLFWFATSFQAGMCQAAVELGDRIKYTVTTKSGVIADARMIKASSSGFLLSTAGKIVFIPLGETKLVSSD